MAFDYLVSTDIEGSMLFNGIPNPKEGIHCALEIALYLWKKRSWGLFRKMTFVLDLLKYTISCFVRLDNTTQNSIWVPESVHIWQYVKNVRSSKLMAIANYTKRINGMRSIPQSLPIRSSKNYLKNNARKIYDTSWDSIWSSFWVASYAILSAFVGSKLDWVVPQMSFHLQRNKYHCDTRFTTSVMNVYLWPKKSGCG